jgi:hypothetical protein
MGWRGLGLQWKAESEDGGVKMCLYQKTIGVLYNKSCIY